MSLSWKTRRNTRRSRRAEVLRVKAEKGPRKLRWRGLVVALLLAGVATLAAHVGLRFWGSLRDGVFLSSRVFGLRAIEVNQQLVWLTPAQIIGWAGVRLGENLLAIDLDRIKRDLELVPQVEEAAVERVLPDTLRIQIRERQPLAQVRSVQADQGRLVPATFFLDGHAKVMPPLGAGRPDLQATYALLPVVSGLGAGNLRVGRDLPTPNVRAAIELVRLFPHSPLAGQVRLATVSVADPAVLLVSTGEGAEVTLPLRQLDLQLHRWRLVHDAGLRQGRTIRWLDLSMTNNCPVLWQPLAPEPAAAPPPPAVESSFTGGNHV
jgi:cell division septal protein FtsQ